MLKEFKAIRFHDCNIYIYIYIYIYRCFVEVLLHLVPQHLFRINTIENYMNNNTL